MFDDFDWWTMVVDLELTRKNKPSIHIPIPLVPLTLALLLTIYFGVWVLTR